MLYKFLSFYQVFYLPELCLPQGDFCVFGVLGKCVILCSEILQGAQDFAKGDDMWPDALCLMSWTSDTSEYLVYGLWFVLIKSGSGLPRYTTYIHFGNKGDKVQTTETFEISPAFQCVRVELTIGIITHVLDICK